MLLTIEVIESKLDKLVILAGEQLNTHGKIVNLKIQNGGQRITAVVNEPDLSPVRVFIRIQQQGKTFTLDGECSCEHKKNCKHVAAVLLHSVNSNAPKPSHLTEQTPNLPVLPDNRNQNTNRQTILYQLHPSTIGKHQIYIQSIVARRLSNGEYDREVDYNPDNAQQRNPPRFLHVSDIKTLSNLARMPRDAHSKWPLLSATNDNCDSSNLLKNILASKRCFYQWKNQSQALHLGKSRPLELFWELDQYATQHLRWRIDSGEYQLMLLSPSPWYVETLSNECGPLNSPYSNAVLNQLLALNPVTVDEISSTIVTLKQLFPTGSFPQLHAPRINRLPTVRAKPYLQLVSKYSLDYAILAFEYDGYQVGRNDPAIILNGQNYMEISRDHAFEKSCHTQLLNLGFVFNNDLSAQTGKDCYCFNSEQQEWINFQSESIAELEAQSWRVDYKPGFRHRLAHVQKWFCATTKVEQQDWFDMSLGVEIDGEQIDLLSALMALFKKYPSGLVLEQDNLQPVVLTLEDGRLLPISTQRLYPIYKTLIDLYADGALCAEGSALTENQYHVKSHQLAGIAELLQPQNNTQWHWLGRANIKQLANNLHDTNSISEVEPPTELEARLRPYQQKGLNWLQFLRIHGFSGILADDMGLGKTVQALAHLLLEKQHGRADKPSLVIAPTSLMFNWRREANRFCPSLKILVLHGQHRHKDFDRILKHDLILSTYPLLVRDKPVLLTHDYHLLILDEAQTIKNPKAQASQIARRIKARHRLCLTGTPMENHLGEIWSLFNFLMPGLLGNSRQFQQVYRNPIEKNASKQATDRLANRLRPFMLRRRKEEVAKELPKKTEITLEVILDGEQRELYETVRLSMHRKIRAEIRNLGIARSQIVILDALLKLRQVCCDPRLLKTENAQTVNQSAKLTLLEELLPELIEEGRRILIFSQFTSMLDLIEHSVKKAHIPYTILTGSTRDREIPVSAFQNGDVPLFLISLKAGGVGLNLTSADTVIHYDPWWNPAVERQATDRAHRMGQKKPVFVYKLICEGTVEESIQTLQQQKQALADNLYNNNSGVQAKWNEQDIMQLFQPIT